MTKKIIEGVKQYYSDKIIQHGATSKGVDWNSTDSQHLRFQQLCKILPSDSKFKILDFGCGYGELFSYMDTHYKSNIQYTGFDISPEMIKEARKKFPSFNNAHFTTSLPLEKHDYSIASGIFNIRLELANDEEWIEYIFKTLITLDEISEKGFSFNALTSYSDKEHKKSYLYYANPMVFFDYCKNHFSKNVALLHDYDLYEFTILVRK